LRLEKTDPVGQCKQTDAKDRPHLQFTAFEYGGFLKTIEDPKPDHRASKQFPPVLVVIMRTVPTTRRS
jgi:hypothetical protein